MNFMYITLFSCFFFYCVCFVIDTGEDKNTEKCDLPVCLGAVIGNILSIHDWTYTSTPRPQGCGTRGGGGGMVPEV